MNASPDITQVKLRPKLKEITAQSECNYYLFSYQSGFTRSGGNIGKEIAKLFLVAIITFGMFYTIPLEFTSDLYVALYDKKNDQIIYYDKNNSRINPTRRNNVDKQVTKIFRNLLKEQNM